MKKQPLLLPACENRFEDAVRFPHRNGIAHFTTN